jgi:signal transduction histidine kinase
MEASRTDNGWRVAVIDNGIGIDPAYFDKIFQVFRKLHTDEAGYKGTGIGLAICKKIAELHSGTIEVVSQPGRGSTFTLFIPDKEL